MPENSLHPDATWLCAHYITTLATVNKELDALLYEGLTLFSGIFQCWILLDFIIQTQTELVHCVYVSHVMIASNTEDKVLQGEWGDGGLVRKEEEGGEKGARG